MHLQECRSNQHAIQPKCTTALSNHCDITEGNITFSIAHDMLTNWSVRIMTVLDDGGTLHFLTSFKSTPLSVVSQGFMFHCMGHRGSGMRASRKVTKVKNTHRWLGLRSLETWAAVPTGCDASLTLPVFVGTSCARRLIFVLMRPPARRKQERLRTSA